MLVISTSVRFAPPADPTHCLPCCRELGAASSEQTDGDLTHPQTMKVSGRKSPQKHAARYDHRYDPQPGCRMAERVSFAKLLASGFADVYRELHPDIGCIGGTWSGSRKQSAGVFTEMGMRLDLCLATKKLLHDIGRCGPLDTATASHTAPVFGGSDHCPVLVDFGSRLPASPVSDLVPVAHKATKAATGGGHDAAQWRAQFEAIGSDKKSLRRIIGNANTAVRHVT